MSDEHDCPNNLLRIFHNRDSVHVSHEAFQIQVEEIFLLRQNDEAIYIVAKLFVHICGSYSLLRRFTNGYRNPQFVSCESQLGKQIYKCVSGQSAHLFPALYMHF